MQHQSAENIFEINTNLGSKEHPPGLQARGPGFGGFGAELGRLGARISSLCCYAHTRGTHHFSPSSLLLLVAAGTELNRRRFTGVGRAAHRRLKRHCAPPSSLSCSTPVSLSLRWDGGRPVPNSPVHRCRRPSILAHRPSPPPSLSLPLSPEVWVTGLGV